MCHNYDESVDHIISGCPLLKKAEYLHRHDKVAAYIYLNSYKQYNLPAAENGMSISPTPLLKVMSAPSYETCQYTLIMKSKSIGLTSLLKTGNKNNVT